jgi:hypothetical protein
MKFLTIPILFLLVFGSACHSSTSQTRKPVTTFAFAHDTNKSKRADDTLFIDRRCAVLYEPDSLQIKKAKKEWGEDTFYLGADDYLWYMHGAAEYLDSQKLKIVNAKSEKYLLFRSPAAGITLIKKDTLQELWGVFLFNPSRGIRKADITSIETDYKEFMK